MYIDFMLEDKQIKEYGDKERKGMGKFSTNSVNGMAEFLTVEIVEKALDGITYTMILKDGKHNAMIEKYDALRKSLTEDGVKSNEIFRRYELSNGIIYDLDLKQAIDLTVKLSAAYAKSNGGKTPIGDFNMREEAEERRLEDIKLFAKKVLSNVKSGKSKFEVALFSRNKVPKIVVTGNDKNGNAVALQFDAFAIRHTDIEQVNRDFLVKEGYRIVKVEPCEVLPSLTGVRFIITVMRV